MIKVNGEINNPQLYFRVMIVIFVSVISSVPIVVFVITPYFVGIGKVRSQILTSKGFECLVFKISACRRATKLIRTAKRSAQWALLICAAC
jgi:hypothetical protein